MEAWNQVELQTYACNGVFSSGSATNCSVRPAFEIGSEEQVPRNYHKNLNSHKIT